MIPAQGASQPAGTARGCSALRPTRSGPPPVAGGTAHRGETKGTPPSKVMALPETRPPVGVRPMTTAGPPDGRSARETISGPEQLCASQPLALVTTSDVPSVSTASVVAPSWGTSRQVCPPSRVTFSPPP